VKLGLSGPSDNRRAQQAAAPLRHPASGMVTASRRGWERPAPVPLQPSHSFSSTSQTQDLGN